MAMATGAVHQALVAAGLRTLAGIAVEAGDCRDIHHAAVLIGYGAGAVCPWLALETALSLAPAEMEPTLAEAKMLKALDAGLAKVMSKMGISVVDSYRGGAPVRHPGAAFECGGPVLCGYAGAAVGGLDLRSWNGICGRPGCGMRQRRFRPTCRTQAGVRFRKADGAEPPCVAASDGEGAADGGGKRAGRGCCGGPTGGVPDLLEGCAGAGSCGVARSAGDSACRGGVDSGCGGGSGEPGEALRGQRYVVGIVEP